MWQLKHLWLLLEIQLHFARIEIQPSRGVKINKGYVQFYYSINHTSGEVSFLTGTCAPEADLSEVLLDLALTDVLLELFGG